MAPIQTAIELNDQFTSVLYGIMDAVNLATAQMYDMRRQCRWILIRANLEGAREAIDEATASLIALNGVAQRPAPVIDPLAGSSQPVLPGTHQCVNRAGRDSCALGNGQSGCVYRNRNGSVRAGSTECQ